MKLGAIGEFGMIERIRALFPVPEGCVGIGDDCAVIDQPGDRVLLVTTDLLVEDVHFLRDRITPEELGHKALAVNLSDIAAMGGKATAAFLSIGLPRDTEVAWIDGFFAGLGALSRATGCALLGGDTTGSPRGVVINIAVLGEAERGRVVYRSGARPGDVLAVTGLLGDSGAGLRLLLEGGVVAGDADERYLVDAHHRPVPHLAEGAWLAATGAVRAMMDVSDGIESDVRHILASSRVGARIEVDRLPVSDAMRRVAGSKGWDVGELAATAGEDYVLLCAVDPARFDVVAELFAARFGRPLRAIGRIEAESGLRLEEGGRPVAWRRHGFDHFNRSGA
ncbi:MAG TPA: thiamine-phosphate kinase [Kiritimatiellia bacterium]|nr:thiamine-phosphate kinase [Kiritimatiellia bacterium]HMP35175.1 thiamine-phosphate kinase [Kiritimatiellia bacterium]